MTEHIKTTETIPGQWESDFAWGANYTAVPTLPGEYVHNTGAFFGVKAVIYEEPVPDLMNMQGIEVEPKTPRLHLIGFIEE